MPLARLLREGSGGGSPGRGGSGGPGAAAARRRETRLGPAGEASAPARREGCGVCYLRRARLALLPKMKAASFSFTFLLFFLII